MENSIYHETIGFHEVKVWESLYDASKGFTRYCLYLNLNSKEWMCIIETHIPNELVLADRIRNF